MATSFLTSLTEQEFKQFLKEAIKEVLSDDLKNLKQDLPDIFNIKEAATFLKCKLTTLYEKTSRKIIPHFKQGNKLYFNRKDLEDWIRAGRVKTKSELGSEASTYLLNEKQHSRRPRNIKQLKNNRYEKD